MMRSPIRIVAAVLAASATACSPADSDRMAPPQPDASESLQPAALTMLETALDAMVEADRAQDETIVIRSDVPASPALSAHGLDLGVLVQSLVQRRHLSSALRDEVMVCTGEIGPRNLHPCKPNFDGRFYQLSVVSFTPTQGKVAIHNGEGGTRVVELVRERNGWKVVDESVIAS